MSFATMKSLPVNECAEFQRRFSAMRTIIEWHQSLPQQLRAAPGCAFAELGVRVCEQLSRSRSADLVHQAIEGISELAEECLDEKWPLKKFTELYILRPRSIELGLLIFGGSLLRAAPHSQDRLRDQEFYPAVLLEDILQTIAGKDDKPARRLLFALVEAQIPELIERLARACDQIDRGYGQQARWPAPLLVDALAAIVEKLKAPWERIASELLYAVPSVTDVLDLGLPQRLAGAPRSYKKIELLLSPLNTITQAQNPRARLLSARDWPRRAIATLRALARPAGWLQLHFAYLGSLLPGIKRRAERLGADAVSELMEREVIYPIAVCGQLLEDGDATESEAGVPPFGLPRFGDTRRQRLHRQRSECLRAFPGTLAVGDLPGPDIGEILRAIGDRYFGDNWAGRE